MIDPLTSLPAPTRPHHHTLADLAALAGVRHGPRPPAARVLRRRPAGSPSPRPASQTRPHGVRCPATSLPVCRRSRAPDLSLPPERRRRGQPTPSCRGRAVSGTHAAGVDPLCGPRGARGGTASAQGRQERPGGPQAQRGLPSHGLPPPAYGRYSVPGTRTPTKCERDCADRASDVA